MNIPFGDFRLYYTLERKTSLGNMFVEKFSSPSKNVVTFPRRIFSPIIFRSGNFLFLFTFYWFVLWNSGIYSYKTCFCCQLVRNLVRNSPHHFALSLFKSINNEKLVPFWWASETVFTIIRENFSSEKISVTQQKFHHFSPTKFSYLRYYIPYYTKKTRTPNNAEEINTIIN